MIINNIEGRCYKIIKYTEYEHDVSQCCNMMFRYYWCFERYTCQCKLNLFELKNKVVKGHVYENVWRMDEQSLPYSKKDEVAVEDADSRDSKMQKKSKFAWEV